MHFNVARLSSWHRITEYESVTGTPKLSPTLQHVKMCQLCNVIEWNKNRWIETEIEFAKLKI